MKNKIAFLEAILFTTNKPLSFRQISNIMRLNAEEVEGLMDKLRIRYGNEGSGLIISELGGFKLAVKDEYLDGVSDLTPHSDLSRGVLRVLSIIAFQGPVKQSEIVKVIGNRTYEYVKTLENRNLIQTKKAGRTKLLETSKQFERYFNINKEKLSDLYEKDE